MDKNSLRLLLVFLVIVQLFGCATRTNETLPSQPPPSLRAIQVTAGELTLPAGFALQLTATGVYADDSTRDLTGQVAWSSSADSIATVSSTGLATGVSPGSVTFTAALDGVSGSSGLTITSHTLTGIEIKPSDPALATGTTRQLQAFAHFSDQSDLEVTSQVTWSVAPDSLGAVSSSGLLTARSAGNGSLSASLAGVLGTTPLTVTGSALVSLEINPPNPTLSPGGQLPLSLTGTFADRSTQTDLVATWSSSQPTVATVDASGLLQGVGGGTSAIVARVGSVTSQTTATVDALVSLEVQPASATLAVEANRGFTAIGTFSNGSTQELTQGVSWSSSDASVSTISRTGAATGVNVGSARITAHSSGLSGSAQLSVQPASVIPDPLPDDPTYFQVLIDNRVGRERTPHLSFIAATVPLNSSNQLNSTWLTGGGPNHDDFTQPVMVVLSNPTGGIVPFAESYDITLDELPLDPTGCYRVLKIPFRDPDNPQQTRAGAGRLYVTLDVPAGMKIKPGGPGGFSVQPPSPTDSKARFDFVELDCSAAGTSFVSATNVDFFSLGFVLRGRQTDSDLETFGLDLSSSRPVAGLLTALAALPGNFGKGTQRSGGKLTRFLAPGLSFPAEATDLEGAIREGFAMYLNDFLEFEVEGTQYLARTVNDTLVFGAPKPFTIDRPSTLNVVASTGPLAPTGEAPVDGARTFMAAALNRGVFTRPARWKTPSDFYPAGVQSNLYAALLHQRFLNGAAFAFPFDDVPAGITTPTIPDCTSMTLVVDDE